MIKKALFTIINIITLPFALALILISILLNIIIAIVQLIFYPILWIASDGLWLMCERDDSKFLEYAKVFNSYI